MSQKCGFVALIGPPNAGKSTLVNHLVGQKVSIVTQKAQTTRMRIRGVMMHGDSQLVLVDTPGVFAPNQRLDRHMVREAWSGAMDADCVLTVFDARHLDKPETELVISGLSRIDRPVLVALNKIDRIARPELLAIIDRFRARIENAEIFLISALKGDGLQDLVERLVAAMPEGPWLYSADQAADIPSQLLAAEITREKLFLNLHQELPYSLTVETDSWKRQKDGSVRIEQTIYVQRDGQKGIILGKRGETIKNLGAQARLEMEQNFEHRVHLFLFVKVRPNWMDDPARYQALGIDPARD